MNKKFLPLWSYMLFSCQTPDNNVIDLSKPARTSGYSKAYNYRIGKNDQSVHLVKQFNNDLLEEEYPDFPNLSTTNGDHIVLQKNTLQIKKLTDTQIKADKKLIPTLKELNEQLKDDGNPVIITGTLKQAI